MNPIMAAREVEKKQRTAELLRQQEIVKKTQVPAIMRMPFLAHSSILFTHKRLSNGMTTTVMCVALNYVTPLSQNFWTHEFEHGAAILDSFDLLIPSVRETLLPREGEMFLRLSRDTTKPLWALSKLPYCRYWLVKLFADHISMAKEEMQISSQLSFSFSPLSFFAFSRSDIIFTVAKVQREANQLMKGFWPVDKNTPRASTNVQNFTGATNWEWPYGPN